MRPSTRFWCTPAAQQSTNASHNSGENMSSPPRSVFTGSLSPWPAHDQPPLEQQNGFSAPSPLHLSSMPETYNPLSHDNQLRLPGMQPSHTQDPYNAFMLSATSLQSAMKPSGTVCTAAQARGMQSFPFNQQHMAYLGNMGVASLTPSQRPMALAYPPSSRAQQLQTPSRTPSANIVRTPGQYITTPHMQAGAPNSAPTFTQKLQAQANLPPFLAVPAMLSPSVQSAREPSKTPSQHTMRLPSTTAPAVQAPQYDSSARHQQYNMISATSQGQKRPAADTLHSSPSANKRQMVADSQDKPTVRDARPGTDQMRTTGTDMWQKVQQYIRHVDPAYWKKAQKQLSEMKLEQKQELQQQLIRVAVEHKKQADQARADQARKTEEEKKKKKQPAATKAKDDAAEKARVEAIAEAKAQAAVREEQRRINQQAILDAEKQKRLAAQQQAWDQEQAEQHRIAQAARLEKERKQLRREQLRKDPSVLYRHYREYLEYFPIDPVTDRTNTYLIFLLANRPMPSDDKDDLALAITWAKEHWEHFMEYPRDVKRATDFQKEKLARLATDKQPSTTTTGASKQPSKR